MRVVSLVPSSTDALAALDSLDLLVGRDHNSGGSPLLDSIPCVTRGLTSDADPAAIDRAVATARQQDGTINTLDAEALTALKPDLILTQQCCGVCSPLHDDVCAVAANISPPPDVLCCDPTSLDDVLDDIERIATAIGRITIATPVLATLRASYWQARDLVGHYLDGPRTAVIEWTSPIYLAGHWTPQLIVQAGGQSIGPPPECASEVWTLDDLIAAAPERIVIAPCGVAIDQITPHLDALWETGFKKRLPSTVRIAAIDGQRSFSRPGPGLIDTVCWLAAWLTDRPDQFPQSFPFVPLDAEHGPTAR